MELKYWENRYARYMAAGSNRTFMELKLRTIASLLLQTIVLIAPLWN